MHSETWLEKAERLRAVLQRLSNAPQLPIPENEEREVTTIAVWLHHEFADRPRHEPFQPLREI
jgi:hypothetical protein